MGSLKKVRIVVSVIVVIVFAGYLLVDKVRSASDTSGGSVSDSIGSVVGSLVEGDVTGEVGKAYLTRWFNFSVLSITRVGEYAGYSPEEGNILLDVEIAELCTFNEPIEMGTSDFFVDADSFLEYVYPMESKDSTMMPQNFTLQPREKVQYHMIFEIPEDAEDLELVYVEIDEKGNEGSTFMIKI
ncbi:MAG: hypothetical protein LBB28_01880 [Synergistaceae bacterium]|jgi:hypothetical protein|nr:hypothetical protein [Synergistaceae bacterium]